MNVWDKVGRSRVVASIARAVQTGQVAHAWLLAGPAGAGKRAVATAMASAINCIEEPGQGCGTCSACARIMRRRHPDVHHVVPEGPLIPVDIVREVVVPEASRSPFEARVKVFIIEEADRMNEAAQNALLKTLEEPQPDTVFVLITAHEEEVLDTIRSRCRIVRLDPVPESRIVELLEEDGAPDDVALLSARLSEGDLDRARLLAEDADARQRRDLWLSIPRRLVSSVDALDAASEIVAEAKQAVKTLEASQKAEVEELSEAIGERRGTAAARNALAKRHKRELRRAEEEALREALGSLASFYRDVVAARHGGTEAIVNLDRIGEVEAWASSDIADADLLEAAMRCIETSSTFDANANALLQFEAALVEVAERFKPPAHHPAPTW